MPFVGAAGVSLAFAGGASANAPTEHTPPQDTTVRPMITLGEEEISDVKLGTFYVFDKENDVEFGQPVQVARPGCRGCGCRGCGCAVRACRGCGGCGCAVRAFGCGCGGCGCGCTTGCRLWTGWAWIWIC